MFKNKHGKWLSFVMIVLAFAISSCATMKREEATKLKNVALLSIISPLGEVGTAGAGDSIVTLVSEITQRDKLSTEPTLNHIRDRIFADNGKLFFFPLANESTVLGEPVMKTFTKQKQIYYNETTAKGYPSVSYDSLGKNEAAKLLSSSQKYDGALVIQVYCDLQKTGIQIGKFSAGKLKATTSITMVLYDRSGEVLMKKTITGESKSAISQVMGWYKIEDVNKVAIEGADDALIQFAEWLKDA